MKMPRPSEDAKAAFARAVPDEPAVTIRPMFGQMSAFVNGKAPSSRVYAIVYALVTGSLCKTRIGIYIETNVRSDANARRLPMWERIAARMRTKQDALLASMEINGVEAPAAAWSRSSARGSWQDART